VIIYDQIVMFIINVINLICSAIPQNTYYLTYGPKDRHLYISEGTTKRVYKVNPEAETASLHVVAGTGEDCEPWEISCGDGGRAIDATFTSLKG
jgi:hypothetical protein